MIEFKENYYKIFKKTGFLKIRNVFNFEDLNIVKQDLDNIYSIAKDQNSSIPVRCYRDIPYFLSKGVNIASIEDPFFYLSKKSIDIIRKYELRAFASKLIKKNKMSIKLSRVHVTGKFRYIGPWHRDQSLNTEDEDVLCNIYFIDEIGMKFFCKTSQRHTDEKFSFDDKIIKKNYSILEAKAGDLIFLDPKLIHQPFSENKRMHLHIRFSSIFSSIIDETSYRNKNDFYQRDQNLLSSLKRIKNLIKQ